eukprot:CAMPEP_0172600108 /NCGR_PEP_ID=MMETSP1068-20121228/20245_1 /TAXON_ID=35684 /ORGANISM="Pseudopedinella elastica, Strain CCMP716" /LENGTH=275 /DNA_ID=CAMNT_0013400617 /DNA_START=317 /DNA_END=1144 /DNA_ORIENTATION=+
MEHWYRTHNSTASARGPCPLHKKTDDYYQGPFSMRSEEAPLVLHSIEPSKFVAALSTSLWKKTYPGIVNGIWRWHVPLALSDEVGEVFFDSRFDEGSRIMNKEGGRSAAAQGEKTRIRVTTLDRFAKRHNFFEGAGIDIIKIDAEGVDGKVLAGASSLIQAQKIQVLVWENPISNYPLTIMLENGIRKETIESFEGLISFLDRVGGLECFMPFQQKRVISLRYWKDALFEPENTKLRTKLMRGNPICIHRKKLPELVKVFYEMSSDFIRNQVPTS